MAPRPISPDVDILDALAGDAALDGGHDAGSRGFAFDANEILGISGSGDEGDDDAFIERSQAAYNRKPSTLKGRTVKKGGGFQAMGSCWVDLLLLVRSKS